MASRSPPRAFGCWANRHSRQSGWPRNRDEPDFNQFARWFTQHRGILRSEEHTSELQSLMRISYAVFCLKKKKPPDVPTNTQLQHTKQHVLASQHKYNNR